MKRLLAFASILVLGCKNSGDAHKQSDQYQIIFENGTDSTLKRDYQNKRIKECKTNYLGSIFRTEYHYNDSGLSEIKGFLLDQSYGHFLEFYGNGVLKTYCYFTGDGNNCSYLRNYEENGHMIYKQGGPLVDEMRVEKDSMTLFYSTLFDDSVQTFVTFNNLPEMKIELKKSYMQPMLLEGKVLLKDSIFKIRTYFVDKKYMDRHLHYDTVYVK